jgi:cytosine/adenosine deaminase-related metal-dependent hydrolase
VLTAKPAALAERANKMQAGSAFIYHCSEGQRGSIGAIAWSPFSNLWLYGQTTDVPAVRAQAISVCLGSDWAPSGTNVLGELKSARLTADHLGWSRSDHDLVMMITCLPGRPRSDQRQA